MASIGGSALATVQAKRFSVRAQRNMRKHGAAPTVGFSGSRTSLYKQMYGSGGRNGVKFKKNLLE